MIFAQFSLLIMIHETIIKITYQRDLEKFQVLIFFLKERGKDVSIRSCMNCTERAVGCHGKCELYLAEKQEHEELRNKKNSYLNTTDFRESTRKRRVFEVIKQYGDTKDKKICKMVKSARS